LRFKRRGDLLGKTSGEELFLLGRERTDRVDLLHTRGLRAVTQYTCKHKISQTGLNLDILLNTTTIIETKVVVKG
jgi:hypothetical protein